MSKEALAQLSDKQQQLERYTAQSGTCCLDALLNVQTTCYRLEIQERSLLRARQEQEALIAKLTYSSMQGAD